MSEPLPNCPLCDTPPNHDTYAGWAWCDNRKCTFHMLAPAREPQWRALAALRKPLSEQEAWELADDAAEVLGLAGAVMYEAQRLNGGETLSDAMMDRLPTNHAAKGVLSRLVCALTGKR